MTISIITINFNDAEGLRRTIESVAKQTACVPSASHQPSAISQQPIAVRHIIIDGASTDGSVDVIREYEQRIQSEGFAIQLHWTSEPDKGIYNAMNKGIEVALGTRVVNDVNRSELQPSANSQLPSANYLQILNAGDRMAADDVIEKMAEALKVNNYPEFMYGNMLRVNADGSVQGKSGEVPYSLKQYYSSTMNHDCCWMSLPLFEKYGLYDENLKIASDWKWFLQAIGLGDVKPVYVDIDVTLFDLGGISEKNLKLRYEERRNVLEEVLPPAVLADYDKHAFHMEQMNRLKRHHLYGVVYFMERVLFKLEKWGTLRNK